MKRVDSPLPFDVGAYLGDTMRLTTIEHGAYMLLLMEYWCTGPLPNNNAVLASITKTQPRTWERSVGPVIRSFFDIHADGLLHQKRMDLEREHATGLTKIRQQAAFARWDRERLHASANGYAKQHANGHAKPHANHDANGMQTSSDSRAAATRARGNHARGVKDSLLKKERKKEPSLRSGRAEAAHPTQSSARDQLWSEGPPILRALTGLPQRKALGVVGKLLKLAGDHCPTVMEALLVAKDTRPIDPVAWLLKAVATDRPNAEDKIAKDWGLPTFGDDGSGKP